MTAKVAREITAQLKAVGIKATVPVKPRRNEEVFMLTMNETSNAISVWPGVSHVEVKGDKKYKQAVINVIEKKRTVTETVELNHVWMKGLPASAQANNTQALVAALRQRFIDAFPVRFPNPDLVSWSVTKFEEMTDEDDDADGIPIIERDYRTFKAQVTASVPASTQSFLVGQDETAQFISMLPKKATSVEQAHKILRPKGVTDKALRQGEWFFEPVSEQVSKQLDALVAKQPHIMDDVYPLESEDETTHYCVQVTIPKDKKPRLFTIGWVTDRRRVRRGRRAGGRFSHHDPLWLGDWHEVIKNTEIEPPPSVSGNGGARSWD